VPLETTFRELSGRLRMLHDMLVALRLTVDEDKPLHGKSALAENLGDGILQVMGTLDDCLKTAAAATHAVGHPLDLDRARRALMLCQEQFHRVEAEFQEQLGSYDKLKDLACLGRERRGEWAAWAGSVKSGVDQCREPLEATRKALSRCWEEIAERVGTTSVSVRTTNIGQKIITKASPSADAAAEGLT